MAALNQVVGHGHVNDVLGPSLRHMAADAIIATWMRAAGGQPIYSSGVALAADFRVMRTASSPVECDAGYGRYRRSARLCFREAARLPKPVGGAADDFKLIVAPGARRMIESQNESAQRLAGRE